MNAERDKLKPTIGFIGMGHMGTPMTRRLLDAGYRLTVHDRIEERARKAEQWGATVAHTPKELAAKSQVVMSSVTNDAFQQEAMFGPDGALAGVRGGSMMIDLSTVLPTLRVVSIRRRWRRASR